MGTSLPHIVSRKEAPSNWRLVMPANTEKRPRKKDRARRSLVETLTSKRPVVVTSGESGYPGSDRKLPQGRKPPGSDAPSRRRYVTGRRLIDHRSGYAEGRGASLGTQQGESSLTHEWKARVTLAKRRGESPGESDNGLYHGEDVAKILNVRGEKSKRSQTDSTRKWVKQKPITQNMLERLKEMKVSSKSRTEEWVKQIPTEKRSYHSSLYKLGNVGNEGDVKSLVLFDSWIYEEGYK